MRHIRKGEYMQKAYVLVNTKMGEEQAVRDKLAEIEGVTKAELVYGVYDIVVTIEHESMSALKQVVNDKVRRVDDVRSTLTMIVTP
jgi:DNA-binding Lrp family transcriptional regulator